MKPILFSTPMVKAILEGRKSQTRRVVKPQPPEDAFECPYWYAPGFVGKDGELVPGKHVFGISALDGEWGIRFPYQPGDILWVRETWYYESEGDRYVYKASSPDYPVNVGVGQRGWRPSIHMPRKAARLFLVVKDVRVERLQEITEEDAIAEGIRIGIGGEPYFSCRDAFVALWDGINGKKYPWESSPWVWVISFERTEKPEATS